MLQTSPVTADCSGTPTHTVLSRRPVAAVASVLLAATVFVTIRAVLSRQLGAAARFLVAAWWWWHSRFS